MPRVSAPVRVATGLGFHFSPFPIDVPMHSENQAKNVKVRIKQQNPQFIPLENDQNRK